MVNLVESGPLNAPYNGAARGLEGGNRTKGFHFSDSCSRQIDVIVLF